MQLQTFCLSFVLFKMEGMERQGGDRTQTERKCNKYGVFGRKIQTNVSVFLSNPTAKIRQCAILTDFYFQFNNLKLQTSTLANRHLDMIKQVPS